MNSSPAEHWGRTTLGGRVKSTDHAHVEGLTVNGITAFRVVCHDCERPVRTVSDSVELIRQMWLLHEFGDHLVHIPAEHIVTYPREVEARVG